MGLAVDDLHKLGQIVQLVIFVAYTVAVGLTVILAAGFGVLHQPVGQIIIVAGGDATCRIYDLGSLGDNRAVPLVLFMCRKKLHGRYNR